LFGLGTHDGTRCEYVGGIVILRVNQADMVESAIQVSAHGEDLALNHQTTDGQIASAQGGWAGSSALAMAERSARWAQTSTVLLTRVSDHSQGLHASAQAFAATENESSNQLQALGDNADTTMGSVADSL
jgi:uncharacterized protein YukE